jgi:hypothetical protein
LIRIYQNDSGWQHGECSLGIAGQLLRLHRLAPEVRGALRAFGRRSNSKIGFMRPANSAFYPGPSPQ